MRKVKIRQGIHTHKHLFKWLFYKTSSTSATKLYSLFHDQSCNFSAKRNQNHIPRKTIRRWDGNLCKLLFYDNRYAVLKIILLMVTISCFFFLLKFKSRTPELQVFHFGALSNLSSSGSYRPEMSSLDLAHIAILMFPFIALFWCSMFNVLQRPDLMFRKRSIV